MHTVNIQIQVEDDTEVDEIKSILTLDDVPTLVSEYEDNIQSVTFDGQEIFSA